LQRGKEVEGDKILTEEGKKDEAKRGLTLIKVGSFLGGGEMNLSEKQVVVLKREMK